MTVKQVKDRTNTHAYNCWD